ncbi:MAG: hypothetical protein O3C27_05505 [Actinomycetota bacterium]|nr:hypothetical protein [Actinomycetota bacterium]
MKITPTPTDEEAAAIAAALEFSWPRSAAEPLDNTVPRWRFSGRWWAKPVATVRRRP